MFLGAVVNLGEPSKQMSRKKHLKLPQPYQNHFKTNHFQMCQHLNELEIHRFTYLQTDIQLYALLQPFGQSSMIKIVFRIVIRIFRIITRIVRITRIVTKLVRIWNNQNRKWNYFSNFQASDQKTPFTKCLTFDPRGSKLIFKTENGIIQTGNGIIQTGKE